MPNLAALHVLAQVEDLARLSFRRQPLYVGVDDTQEAATREGLEQGYCCVPSAQRFLLLFTFLKKNAGKKVHCSHAAVSHMVAPAVATRKFFRTQTLCGECHIPVVLLLT